METVTGKPFNRFDIPVKFGIVTGLVMAVLSTIRYMFLADSFPLFLASTVIFFIIYLIMYYVTANQQRKAMGGIISIQQAFSAIFIAILISVSISFIYNFIYVRFIDTGILERITNTSIAFAEKMGAPESKLDDIAKQAEEQRDASANIGKQIAAFFIQIIQYSIFGFICAAIVKSKKPKQLA